MTVLDAFLFKHICTMLDYVGYNLPCARSTIVVGKVEVDTTKQILQNAVCASIKGGEKTIASENEQFIILKAYSDGSASPDAQAGRLTRK